MRVIQNRMLRIIGIKNAAKMAKYGICEEPSTFIENACFESISKILNSPTHPLPASLRLAAQGRRTRFPFHIPIARGQKFNESPVMWTLRRLRDSEQFKR